MIAIPKGWRRVPVGAPERLNDRYRFADEGGSRTLGKWSPLKDPSALSVRASSLYITIRKIKKHARRKSK